MTRLTLLCALAAFGFATPALAGPGGGGGGGGGCLKKPANDCDGDGLTNATEATLGTDPGEADTDADGLDDGDEHLVHGTDPLDPDTDGDDLDDGDELVEGTNPFDHDSDDDYVTDGEEVHTYGSDPLDEDTDDDNFLDNYEAYYGTDPHDPDTDGDGVNDDLDCFRLDPTEWEDQDEDGIGTNSDTVNIIDDAREVVGGSSLASSTTFPATADLIYCAYDMTGPVEEANDECDLYEGITMDSTHIGGSIEWDEWLDARGVWNFRWGAPTIAASSTRLVGPRITALAGYTTCYEGEIQAPGGWTDFGLHVSGTYYFQQGQFQLCVE